MRNVITPLMIETDPTTFCPHERSDAARSARRRDEHHFVRAHSGRGACAVYRLVYLLGGGRP